MNKSNKKLSQKQRIKARRAAAKKKKMLTRNLSVVILIAAAGFSLFTSVNRPKANQARMEKNPTKGNPNAAVILTEYADFGCEACQAWHKSGEITKILTQFEGDLAFVWRDFPIILPPYSNRAAEAGQCAFDQDKFWEFHDATYERSDYSALRNDDLFTYAELAGLEMENFETCFDSKIHTATVKLDLDAARDFGFRGTPSFTVNGQQIVGASPSVLVTAIQNALSTQ
ncbi:MAG: DsbA family protein [Chloroflexota bacterium]